MALSASDLAGIRLAVNAFLSDSVTIARTSVTTTCRVTEESAQYRPKGTPSAFRFRRWRIVMPALVSNAALDVRAADVLTVPGRGTYAVIELGVPRTNNPSTEAYCIQTAYADGSSTVMTNATVTFKRLQLDGTYAASAATAVYIEPVQDDEVASAYASRALYEVWFPSSTQIAGIAIQPDDTIAWSGLISAEGMATLHRPMVHPGPILYSCARFEEVA